MALEADMGAAADATIRVPANIMALLRQSYATRERVLDWMLAIFVVGTLAWVYRDKLLGLGSPQLGPNAGSYPDMQPNQDVRQAFPNTGAMPRVYSYNLPPSRRLPHRKGPSAVPPPGNPSDQPAYPVTEEC